MSDLDSPYSRLNYRRLFAWPQRIEREWPFLQRALAEAPSAAVVDLGCGTGEHSRHLASKGFRAVGIDQSETQIAEARDFENEFGKLGPEFLQGEIADLARLTGESFGAALCLGNVMPHLDDVGAAEALGALAERLLPAGRVIIQLINYERILNRGIRSLPINFRDDPDQPDGEIAFVRLMTPDGERHVRFYPTTLSVRPDQEPPVQVVASREVKLRAWRHEELISALAAAGLQVEALHGDMTGGAFDARRSSDLVVVARRG